jgi:O-antigen/teichoic acid export membrane protein
MAINTMATYGRSLFSMILALFSSRWVLDSLGQTDFGLYNVVGSIIVFIIFLNSVMAGSISRFLAFSIGEGNDDDINCWFNTAFFIHLCAALGLIAVGWPIGEFVVRNVLSIPSFRFDACLAVFRISLISAFVSMLSVPFVAMFTAKQHMAELAIWGLLQTAFSFLVAFCLPSYRGDRLVAYSCAMVCIVVLIQLLQVMRAHQLFPECRIVMVKWFSKHRMMRVFSFSGWAIIDSCGAMLRNQGTSVLLNVFFGAKLNAAYGVANQVSAQTSQLSGALMNSFSPEITRCEGCGEREKMLLLSDQAGKFGTILMAVFTLPMLMEIDYILKLWLHNPPPYTGAFCRLILITFLFDRITTGVLFAVNAKGDVAGYQATVGLSQLLTLPLAWACLKCGFSPESVGYAFIMTTVLITIGRLFWLNRLFDVALVAWYRSVLLPICLVIVPALFAVSILHTVLCESFVRLCAVSAASGLVTLVLSIRFAMNSVQRQMLLNRLKMYLAISKWK